MKKGFSHKLSQLKLVIKTIFTLGLQAKSSVMQSTDYKKIKTV